jgi:(S)-3,5-dihydroxyphenylglycine transaminase
MELAKHALHPSVSDPTAASMTFLNEIAERYPKAISLAAGRPRDGFYDAEDVHRYLTTYLRYRADRGMPPDQVDSHLLQYGHTNGQIQDLIVRFLERDEGIRVPPEAVAVTVGCQEAMVIALRGLYANPTDVLLVPEPSYVGITGAARLLGIDVVPVPEDAEGLDPRSVVAVASAVRRSGRNPVALYAVPNFSNPSGVSLSLHRRRGLLVAAIEADLVILEDDPYGLFGQDEGGPPTLKALDTEQRVIYLGSFAKSCFPGARIGFLVADQTVVDERGQRRPLAEALATVKSMLTVNTSGIAQAVIGGMLIESGFSLRAANRDKIAFYRANLRALLDALAQRFPASVRAASGIGWSVPSGGFFVVLHVPGLDADETLLERSAREYGVIWTPMRFFHTDGHGDQAIRLSCSYLEPDGIREGVARLTRLIVDRH